MKKSFSLIEILIATAIFMTVAVITMATLVAIMGSKAKASSMRSVQETNRLAIEMMAGEIKRADMDISRQVTLTGSTKKFYGFWIGSYDGNGVSSAVPFEGPALRIFKPDNKVRLFRLEVRTGEDTFQTIATGDGRQCPEGQQCALRMIDTDGTDITTSTVSSPDVNATSLTFRGYHKYRSCRSIFGRVVCDTNPPSDNQQPYVTIETTVQSRWQTKAQEQETVTLKTTVSPESYRGFLNRLYYLYVVDDSGEWLCRWNRSLSSKNCSAFSGATETGGDDLTSDGRYLYVTDDGGEWIQKIDMVTWTEVAKVKQNSNVIGLESRVGGNGITVDQNFVYVVDDGGDWLSRWGKDLNPATKTYQQYLHSDYPGNLSGNDITSDGTYLYVTDESAGWIKKVDPVNAPNFSLVQRIDDGPYIGGTGIAVDRNSVWVVNDPNDWLCRWDKNFNLTSRTCRSIPNYAGGNDVASDTSFVYATDDEAGEWIIKLNPINWSIQTVKGTQTGGDGITVDTAPNWDYE